MGLKANFEETPTLLAPPSYLDSTSDDDVQLSSRQESHRNTNIAPRYIAWKLILRTLIGSAQITALQGLDQEEERAAALLDVLSNIRLLSRLLYSVSMSLLRPMYFAEYLKAIQATVYSTNLQSSSLDQPCRETRVLDHYISYRIQRRHLASQSSLLLNNDDIDSDQRQVSRDLFKWFQPQTYMEDEIGKVLHSSAAPSNAVRFEDLLVRFHFTKAAITLPFAVESTPLSSSTSAPAIVRKDCVSLDRASNEPVFVSAHRLFDQLNRFIFVRKTHGSKTWYVIVGQTG